MNCEKKWALREIGLIVNVSIMNSGYFTQTRHQISVSKPKWKPLKVDIFILNIYLPP